MDPAQFVSFLLNNYLAIALLFFIISSVLASLVYMFGSFLMNEKIKGWAKMEMYEIMYSAVILTVVLTLVPMLTTITNAALNIGQSNTMVYISVPTPSGYVEQQVDLCNPNQNIYGYENITQCHIRLGLYYLRTIYDEGKAFGYMLLRTYSWTSLASETSVTIQTVFEKAGMEMWVPWKGFFSRENQVIEDCVKWLTMILFLSKFQEIMIRYFAIALFPILLVAGAILRTFTFTRRLGGLLMAIAIAGYFIYPAIYSIGGLLIIKIKDEARPAWLNSPANPNHLMDPPIINTLYMNESAKKVGNIQIFDNQNARDIEAKWNAVSEEERQEKIREALRPGFDLSPQQLQDSENIIKKGINAVIEWVKYFLTHNFFVDTVNDWRDGGYIEVTARLTFFSIFFFLFSIFGTIAAIRSISMTLGGDIELAGLTRLI